VLCHVYDSVMTALCTPLQIKCHPTLSLYILALTSKAKPVHTHTHTHTHTHKSKLEMQNAQPK